MEKEIVWTDTALKDFWQIVTYLKENWPQEVLKRFSHSLDLKIKLVQNIRTSDLKALHIHDSEKHWLTNIIC
ncbi:MAG: hypothetical protein WDM71_05590 [Ferruginibacter sp.]